MMPGFVTSFLSPSSQGFWVRINQCACNMCDWTYAQYEIWPEFVCRLLKNWLLNSLKFIFWQSELLVSVVTNKRKVPNISIAFRYLLLSRGVCVCWFGLAWFEGEAIKNENKNSPCCSIFKRLSLFSCPSGKHLQASLRI